LKRYDLIIIGTGPGDHGASMQAAKLGKSVVTVERPQVVGGNAINTVTIPSKTLREAVMFLTGYLQRGV
jgi:NAD(P) transhydrogenase